MRRLFLMCALPPLLASGGCARPPRPAPEVVTVKVAAEDMDRYRAMAARCGAASTRTETIGEATLLFVGTDSPRAARDCFFDAAGADYRRHHPLRAWIEDRIG